MYGDKDAPRTSNSNLPRNSTPDRWHSRYNISNRNQGREFSFTPDFHGNDRSAGPNQHVIYSTEFNYRIIVIVFSAIAFGWGLGEFAYRLFH